MTERGLVTFSEAANEFGIFRHTIGDLVRRWGIIPKPMSNRKAKGLDAADMKILRRALNATQSGRETRPDAIAS